MANESLVKDFQLLLEHAGLEANIFDQLHWARILELKHAINARETESYPSVEDDEVKEWILRTSQELAKSGGVWNLRIGRMIPALIQAARECIAEFGDLSGRQMMLPAAEELLVSEFPTGEFNASARKVRSGFIALVNVGLLDTLSHLCSLLPSARNHIGLEFNEEILMSCSRFSVAIAKKYFDRSGFAFVQGVQLPSTTKFDKWLNECVLNATCAFVLSHELAHIILGHCDKDGTSLNLSFRPDTQIRPEWQEELSADTLGVLILNKWATSIVVDQMTSDGLNEEHAAEFLANSLYGALYFLECERLIAAVLIGEAKDRFSSSTHPPSSLRQANLVRTIRASSPIGGDLLKFTAPNRRFFRKLRSKLNYLRDNAEIELIDTTTGNIDDFHFLINRLLTDEQ